MKRSLMRITVLLLVLCMTAAFMPSGVTNTAFAEVGSGLINNVNIDENGIMTWDPVPDVSEYIIIIDGYEAEIAREPSFDIASEIDELIGYGQIDNKGNHKIYIETYHVGSAYSWIGTYRHFYQNVETDTVFRYFGDSRYETALMVADAFKQRRELDKFKSAIIADGRNYADALAGSYLSFNANAPILLVDTNQSHITAVQDYIRANVEAGGTIYLLGGAAVVPESVKDGLSGYNFKRLGGSDRYETNLQILSEGGDIVPWFASDIIVCSGTGFADSLSAAATGDPIMLVKGNSLTAGQMQYLQTLSSAKKLFITVVGGTGAVSKNIFTQLKAYGDVYRVGGKDRYETSQLFAEHYFDAITSSAVLAFGGNFPDGLCGGSLANSMGAPLILTANGKTSAAENYVRGNGISYGAVLGGTTLISDASAKAIFDVSEDSNVVVVK